MRREAELSLFGGHVQLEQAGDDPVAAASLFVYFLKQSERVHGVDERDKGSDVFHLVRLKVANEVPLDVGRQGVVFANEFLSPAFAKHTLACVVGLKNGLGGMKF